ncbi:hypothetical protein SPRG_00261 [Saprolegnia parasitica CBS 223.65]|uniref:histone acetyltransferase n=1 Tax=Saprolegnia parasitica (strain CBS 223.65) TaxID=695850 RepID=A0A067D9S8_SAPPC|nr:hypothetical protein SPRG_00261 [Saprolegnia parasitica CBS 223.65]KDO35411.1 hypothetical protein SPRG_00261 [Saprolegnia parasitica CBS 223.65]|eukprot:XP_012193754.1 hypothetical protein SPRG_00261 [Saprolegnia parasitica CBS 223.65]
MATPEEQKFQVYNQALLHASTCRLPECSSHDGRCHKVRASINHFSQCYAKRRTTSRIDEIEECKHCGKIFGLLCYHAKVCMATDKCQVHMCDYLRRKMGQQAAAARGPAPEAWPIERRLAQAEQDRVQILELLRHIVRQKYANGDEIQPYYQQFLH